MGIKNKGILSLFLAAAIASSGLLATNVSAADGDGATAPVATNWAEFKAALEANVDFSVNGNIVFEEDVTTSKIIRITGNSTFDLAGHKFEQKDNDWATIATFADLTITGNGEFTSSAYYPIRAQDGNLTIENGKFTNTNEYYFIQTADEAADSVVPDGKADANVYIKGGEFNAPYSVINNFGPGEVVITGGKFVSEGDSEGYGDALLNSYAGKFELNGDIEVTSLARIIGDDLVDAAEERGAITCTRAIVYELEDSKATLCGISSEEDEDAATDDGQTISLINNTHITFAKGVKFTNNGTVYVDASSSFKICRDDYEGDEAAITGEGEISFECEEEVIPEEEVAPETEPETVPTTDADPIEAIDNVPNPATADAIVVYASLLVAFAFGLAFSIKNFIATLKNQ